MPNEDKAYALAIVRDVERNGWTIRAANQGIPREVIITMLRHWIKAVDADYHTGFTGTQHG
ncbi:hypothetical protein HY642_05275 [Candidatus Woesearchaeota archaeon]|nr:hypothetical protein [Candidatus Woesearchaeota archaeon]